MLRVMHVTFALFADAANLSQEGKLNILGVFDALQVATLPAMHPRATLVVHLKGSVADAGTHRVSLQWLSPSGIELWSSDGELGVASPPSGVLDIDLPLDLAGGYVMRVGLDGTMHAEVPVQVRSAQITPQAPTPAYLS
jgi:hypothetical protein